MRENYKDFNKSNRLTLKLPQIFRSTMDSLRKLRKLYSVLPMIKECNQQIHKKAKR